MHPISRFGILSLLAYAASADFHLATVVQYPFQESTGMTIDLSACPSNYYNCDCFYGSFSDDRGGVTNYNDPGVPSFFSIIGDGGGQFCGIDKLNCYQDENANTWKCYIDGGDGSVVADCSPGDHFGSYGGDHDLECTNINGVGDIFDQLICTSYICNP